MAEQLGYLNFPALVSYNWTKEDFEKWQNYLKKDLRQLILARHGYGVITGCKVSVVAGMTLDVSEGLILFPGGDLVSFPGGQVDIAAADPAQTRFDRLSLAYSVADGAVVFNTKNAPLVLDKLKNTQVSVSAGALGGATPAAIAGQVSLASIKVTAALVNLSVAEIDQSQKYRSLSQDIKKHSRQYDIPNNVGVTTDLADLYFDGALLSAVKIEYFSRRKDEAQVKKCFGSLSIVYDEVAAVWRGEGSSAPDNTGLVLGVAANGKLVFQSTAFSAIGYEGKFEILNIDYIYQG